MVGLPAPQYLILKENSDVLPGSSNPGDTAKQRFMLFYFVLQASHAPYLDNETQCCFSNYR